MEAQDLHLWLHCRGDAAADSDSFRRELLSRYVAIAPADLRFSRSNNGKPALAESPRALQFNLSDSGQWAACAVTANAEVGCDLEYCDSQRNVMKLARRFFQPRELADLRACGTDAQRRERFYEYWTLKEARIKSAGGSLGRELEATGFGLDCPPDNTGPGVITAAPPLPAAFEYHCLLQPMPAYRLALCCQTLVEFCPRLSLFELLPDGQVRSRDIAVLAVGNAAPGKGSNHAR